MLKNELALATAITFYFMRSDAFDNAHTALLFILEIYGECAHMCVCVCLLFASSMRFSSHLFSHSLRLRKFRTEPN